MEITRLEKLRTHRQRLIQDLLKGKDFASQLQNLLKKPNGGEVGFSAEELVVYILRSFTDCLSLLTFPESDQIPAAFLTTADQALSACLDDQLSQDSSPTKRRPPAAKDPRGGYRRRKLFNSRIITSSTTEDEFAWRKYGQKRILNSQHPRCYYRCTHKYDQGCKAMKQVQKIDDKNQSLYQTTYFGHHTCNMNTSKGKKFISDSDPVESYLLSFETKNPTEQYDASYLSTTSVKDELKEETQSNLSANQSSLDSSLWSVALESLESPMVLSPGMGTNHEDMVSSVYSCASTSSLGLDIEDFMAPVDFGMEFHFDGTEFAYSNTVI